MFLLTASAHLVPPQRDALIAIVPLRTLVQLVFIGAPLQDGRNHALLLTG